MTLFGPFSAFANEQAKQNQNNGGFVPGGYQIEPLAIDTALVDSRNESEVEHEDE